MTKKEMKKSEKTRKHLLKVALGLFAQNGFEGTTMRGVASKADMSLGAAYYYFSSKDELVLAFYQNTADEARTQNTELIAASKNFEKRFRDIIEFKLQQLLPHRHLVKVLARHGADFSHPLSPFSRESTPMRVDAINLIEQAIEGSNFKCSKILMPYIATILWLYQMGIILFWSNDDSADQEKTHELLSLSLSMLTKLLKFSALPIFAPINKAVKKIVEVMASSFESTESSDIQTVETR